MRLLDGSDLPSVNFTAIMDDEAKCHVRRAVVTDSDTISTLNADVQAIHAAAIPWLFKPSVDVETFPSSAVATLLMKNETLMYLALDGQHAIGYIYAEVRLRAETSYSYALDEIFIHHLSVRPRYRSQGIGSALLGAIRHLAAQVHISHLAADFWAFNEAAARFFKKHGFEPYNQRVWLR